jgi:hypothetical protein
MEVFIRFVLLQEKLGWSLVEKEARMTKMSNRNDRSHGKDIIKTSDEM